MGLAGGSPRTEAAQISGRTGSFVIKGLVFTFAIVGPHQLAKRIKRVVGNSAGPDQLPQRFHGVAGETAAAGVMNFGKKRCTLAGEKFSNFFRALGVRSLFGSGLARRH